MKIADNIPKSLARACQRYAPQISEVWHEGEDGYWVLLARGFRSVSQETHAIHEWTVKDTIRELGNIVPCSCPDCKPKEP